MSFYLGRYAQLYDLFYREKPYAQEAHFVYDRLREFGRAGPQRILELACGTGTHAIEFAKLGCTVTAIDCSGGMLAVAVRKAVAAGASITFEEGDMRALSPPQVPYDAVICLFDSIGYVLTDENLARVFAGVRRNLAPDGVFIFEFWHAPTMRRHFDPLRVRQFETAQGKIIRISETTLVPQSSVAEVKYDIYELGRDGTYRHFSETQSNRFFSVPEMTSLAKAHGIRPMAAYSGFAKSTAITDDTWHIVMICKAGKEP